jgi:hypothetical protein
MTELFWVDARSRVFEKEMTIANRAVSSRRASSAPIRNVTTGSVVVLLVVLIVSAHASPIEADQNLPHDLGAWSQVQALSPGAEIVVTIKGSGAQVRHFLTAQQEALLLRGEIDPTVTETIAREDIVEISSITKAVRRGTAIGAIIGLVVGGIAQHGSPGWTVLMGVISGGWGAVIGKDVSIRRVIYRAP